MHSSELGGGGTCGAARNENRGEIMQNMVKHVSNMYSVIDWYVWARRGGGRWNRNVESHVHYEVMSLNE